MIVFSQRHKYSIDSVTTTINRKTRQKIIYCMDDFNYSTGRYNSIFYNDLKQELLKTYGDTTLKAFVGDSFQEVDSIEQFIIGTKPEYVLDAIELYGYSFVKQESEDAYYNKINEIFKVDGSCFRILDKIIIKLDSDFLESEIINKAYDLLKNNSFEKACSDFISAKNNFTSCDYSGTISEANNALESTIKKIVNSDNEKQKNLKDLLMKSGLIPDYFQGFCDYFEGLLQSSFTIANKSSRHGKKDIPDKKNDTDRALASFLLNLSGSLIVFIMERYEDRQEEDEIPF